MLTDYGRNMTIRGLNSTGLSSLLLRRLRQGDGTFTEILDDGMNARPAWAWSKESASEVSSLVFVGVHNLASPLLVTTPCL